jgi:hypothetical protein
LLGQQAGQLVEAARESLFHCCDAQVNVDLVMGLALQGVFEAGDDGDDLGDDGRLDAVG